MPARSLAEWAEREPAARDAVLALADQAVALQPAAEAVIQWFLLEGEVGREHVEEGRRVERAYRELAGQLDDLRVDPVVGEPLAGLLDRHLELVRDAMEGASPPQGLGRVAGVLVGLRDLLRRTARLRGRSIADMPSL
ncbi:MAG TPA: hypothetical protein VE776_03450 [Actinomycetota bacterium]|jgi:hypothetical protein|nr:hypothetical protein [Actinomycetota bacterium]